MAHDDNSLVNINIPCASVIKQCFYTSNINISALQVMPHTMKAYTMPRRGVYQSFVILLDVLESL